MSRISEWHKQVDANGIGKCSVPMWSDGCPAGFCDQPAYGERPEGDTRVRWDGYIYRTDHLYAGYVPGLACSAHGGPNSRVFMDGNAWCAVYPDFTNLQESAAGFGDTPEKARAALEQESRQ